MRYLKTIRPDIRAALARHLRPKALNILRSTFMELSTCEPDICGRCAVACLDITVPGYDRYDLVFEAVLFPEDNEAEEVCFDCNGSIDEVYALSEPDYGGAIDAIGRVHSDADPGL